MVQKPCAAAHTASEHAAQGTLQPCACLLPACLRVIVGWCAVSARASAGVRVACDGRRCLGIAYDRAAAVALVCVPP